MVFVSVLIFSWMREYFCRLWFKILLGKGNKCTPVVGFTVHHYKEAIWGGPGFCKNNNSQRVLHMKKQMVEDIIIDVQVIIFF